MMTLESTRIISGRVLVGRRAAQERENFVRRHLEVACASQPIDELLTPRLAGEPTPRLHHGTFLHRSQCECSGATIRCDAAPVRSCLGSGRTLFGGINGRPPAPQAHSRHVGRQDARYSLLPLDRPGLLAGDAVDYPVDALDLVDVGRGAREEARRHALKGLLQGWN